MLDCDPIAKDRLEAVNHLGGQSNFGYQYQTGTASGGSGTNQIEKDQRLAAAGNPVQQRHARSARIHQRRQRIAAVLLIL